MNTTHRLAVTRVTRPGMMVAAALLALATMPFSAQAASLDETASWLKEHVMAWNAYDDIRDVRIDQCVLMLETKSGERIQADLRGEKNLFSRVQHGRNLYDVAIRPQEPSALTRARQEGGVWTKEGNPAIYQISISAKRGEGIPEETKAGQILDALQNAARMCHDQPPVEQHPGLK